MIPKMKRLLLSIPVLIIAACLAGSCVREMPDGGSADTEGMVDCVISFGSPRGAELEVGTKAELGIVRESNVFNIYLLVFDGNSPSSKKVYGHYFDGNNLGTTGESNYWTVTNMSADTDPATYGTIHFRTSKKAGCSIVAVANMNPNDLDVSAGLLSGIQTYGDLQNIVATQVRSEIAANSGFFLMTGEAHGVNIQGNSEDTNDISKKSLLLKRLYAKVKFNVRITKDAPIRAFVPDRWQVVNIPTCSYLLERTAPYTDAADTEAEFFSTDALGFETETVTTAANDYYADGVTKVSIHSFSFYMMENRNAPKSGISSYADREKQDKNSVEVYADHYTAVNGDWTYASPLSTYVVITGKIVMDYDAGVNPNATLDANVRYVIHLGNFGADNTDFNTLRNYNYEYNIFINGADDIKAEVVSNDGSSGSLDENEPGATGQVVVALEEIFNSDCHYSSQVISFHAQYIDQDRISWYVETPFNPDGIGPNDGVDLTNIDYKWVEFRINDKDGSGNYYSNQRVIYKPHDYPVFSEMERLDPRRTFYVNELVDFLKAEKEQYDIDIKKSNPDDPSYDSSWEKKSHFDNSSDAGGPKITVTAFVNEYYYTVNPLSGVYDPTMWKDIVNYPMRRMHILASSSKSADGESTLIGSSFTIQQRSIQSIYAVQETADLQSAWGMEFKDDETETGAAKFWKYKEQYPEDLGNTSSTNGRLNSMKLWGILDPDGNIIQERWDTFMNLNGTNETPQLLSDYNYLRYSCLSRNRDNDGDEIIDPEEIRWYMASDVQLVGVFLGAYGIEGDARLYQRSATHQASGNKNDWRQHVIASNRYLNDESVDQWNNSNRYARVIWAEEGANGSSLNVTGNEQTDNFSTRCVRNLGYYMDGGQRKDITLTEDTETEPNAYVTVTRKHLNEDGTVTVPFTGAYDNRTFYEFDCSRINLASLREPVDHELIGHDENSKMACLPAKFESAPEINLINLNNYTNYSFNNRTYNLKKIEELNKYLDDSFPNLDVNFRECPEGYRLPNAKEMTLMWNTLTALPTGDSDYLGKSDNNASPSRTHWSMGREGSRKMANKWGWGMSDFHMLMSDVGKEYNKPRCVRDL